MKLKAVHVELDGQTVCTCRQEGDARLIAQTLANVQGRTYQTVEDYGRDHARGYCAWYPQAVFNVLCSGGIPQAVVRRSV